MNAIVEWMHRHRAALYIAGLTLGAAAGLWWTSIAQPAEIAIHPVLALLLFSSFLRVPFGKIGHTFHEWHFCLIIPIVNFAFAPVAAWLLSRSIADEEVLLVGVLFVLLTPWVDHVIVFTGIAGGDEQKLLVAAPMLMLAQMRILPLHL